MAIPVAWLEPRPVSIKVSNKTLEQSWSVCVSIAYASIRRVKPGGVGMLNVTISAGISLVSML